jgi:hypothetical protein
MLLRSLILFALVVLSLSAGAQPPDEKNRDSIHIYQRIQTFSEKNRFLYMLYESVFRPVNPRPVKNAPAPHAEIKPVYFRPYEGKYIRRIRIQTFDPFGYDPNDTSIAPKNFLQRSGNAVHIKTMNLKVRNTLQIRENEKFDSLKVKETERLIRLQSSVREVFVIPELAGKDSVDLHIRVYDVWSIIVTGYVSTSNIVTVVRDKNFLGLGHQFNNRYSQQFDGKYAYELNYYVPSISNTFINSTATYKIDENKNYSQGLSLDRPFYSVLTQYGYGASFLQQVSRGTLKSMVDSSLFLQKYVSNSHDYWFGRSWQLTRGNSEADRTQNLITSLRYMRIHYLENAPEGYDSLHLRDNEDFWLFSVGVSKRNYKQDNYIFNYGFTEDVPTGRAFSFIGGYQIKDELPRWYFGSKIYLANYHPWGYLNSYVEYGAFLHDSNVEEGTVTAGLNYFSNLISVGRWKLRQFIKPTLTLGVNRRKTDNLSINDEAGIRGFNSEGLQGTQKATLTLQLQSYAPWNILGFRFGPFLVCTFGMLGTEQKGFNSAPVYSSIGLGLLIKNEFLVISNFQVSLAFYPRIPGVGEGIFKTNPVKTTDFGFRGFDISRPSPVSYY